MARLGQVAIVVGEMPERARLLADLLARQDWSVELVADVAAAARVENQRRAERRPAATLMVIDWTSPDFDLAAEIRRFRAGGDPTKLLVVAEHAETSARGRLARAGANLVLSGEFSDLEFLDWAWSLGVATVAEPRGASAAQRSCGPFEIDLGTSTLRVDGSPIGVRPAEFKCMALLIERRGSAVPLDDFQRLALGYVPGVQSETVRKHISNLKKAVGPRGRLIVCRRPRAYLLSVD